MMPSSRIFCDLVGSKAPESAGFYAPVATDYKLFIAVRFMQDASDRAYTVVEAR